MKVLAAALLLSSTLAMLAQTEPTRPNPITVTINTQQTMDPVPKYEYGMFIEHIRDSWYRGLWSELIEDRKFYFPITSAAPEPAPQQQAGGPPRGPAPRRWHPVGPDEAVTMDKEKPFVGDQSPRIALDASTAHGIRQSGIALVKGKRYVGHIILRSTPGAHMKVALVWGTAQNERQVIALNAVPQTYKTFPLNFTAPADASDAALEVTGTGTGDFHIGTLTLMPADNIDGFRPDAIALLKQINMGFWRYGGNYTSGMIWYHIVGNRDKRPPDFDYAWNAMQPNDLGLDEFMTLCRLIHVEPYISVNAGFGDSHSAAEEVEYMNGSTATHMGAMRAQNGHPQPYHVKFWNIGNEPWGSWQLGRTDTKYFMLKHNEFAKAMRAVDPSIVLIASGRMLQDDGLRGEERAKYEGNLGPLYGTDVDWTGNFLKHCFGNFDGIAEHWYAQPGRRFDIEKAKKLPPDASNEEAYVKVDQTLLESARYPANVVLKKAEEWEGYEQRFPEMRQNHIFLSIDEYAYFGGGFNRGATLKTGLAYGLTFDEMLRHTDFLKMAAHTTGLSMLDFNRTASTFSTTGLVFKLYADHFVGAIPVELSGNSPQPAPKYPAVGDQPDRTSGSPTYPLDMVAALSPDHRYLILSVVNATESPENFDISIAGVRPTGPGKLWQLTGASVDAANRVGHTPEVSVTEHSTGPDVHSLSVAPISINIYQFPIAAAQ